MTISGWTSRISAFLILAAIVSVLQLTLGQPLIDSFIKHRESIRQSQDLLAKYRQLNASRPKINVNLDKLRKMQESEGRLLTGGSTQLVGAKLQNRLKELIEASQANLVSMQLLAVREDEGYQRVSMVVALNATIESLQSILYEIENQTPYFFIEKLELRKDRGYVGADESRDSNELQVRIEFYGYMPRESRG